MSQAQSDDLSLEQLAEDYLQRRRAGHRPSVEEYQTQYPHLAEKIAEFFPALCLVEEFKPEQLHDKNEKPQEPAIPYERLGDFRLLREVGRGGMGVVYEAEQLSLGRRVALKVLLKHQFSDARLKGRFEREARAVAKLHHTNIVPIFGAGEQEGVHYYVMQFIHGLGLDEVLIELQRLREESASPNVTAEQQIAALGRNASALYVAQSLLSGRLEPTRLIDDGNPSSEFSDEQMGLAESEIPLPNPQFAASPSTAVGHLSDTFLFPGQSEHTGKHHSRQVYWQSVARIGVQAAEALQYAHSQGVIHRDIKPGNLLLDTYGCVWVTDFGLAKAADQKDLTHTGDVLGTLRYMSPEQFDGKADRRSDVYSLGLTLYEMLALRPAFNEKDRHKLIKQVSNETPMRLRTIDSHIPRDLETIVHKAIDREPAQRYQSAGELAADLERYLGNEPVRAKWVSPFTRFSRWCKRNPAIAGLTSLIAALLILVAVVSGIAAVWFENVAQEANKDKAAAVAAKQDAETAQNEAEAAARRERELRATAERERDRANTEFARARRAVDDYLSKVTEEELLSVPGLQPLRQELLAAALKFYVEFTEEHNEDRALQIEFASAQYRLGQIHRELGNQAAANIANVEAIQLLEALRDTKSSTVEVRSLLAEAYFTAGRYDDAVQLCQKILKTNPEAEKASRTLAETYNTLALQKNDAKDYTVALELHQKAFVIREKLVGRHPENAGYNAGLASTLNNIAVLLGRQEKAVEALAMYQQALGYIEKACRLAPHSILWGRWLAITSRNIGSMQRQLSNPAEALQAFERQAIVWRRLRFQNPAVTSLRADYYKALLLLAGQQERMGRATEANRSRRDAREVLAQIPKASPEEQFELATVYAALAAPPEVGQSSEKDDADAADERQRNADLSVQTLQRAVDAGWADPAALKNYKALDSLREREDFQMLVMELEARLVVSGETDEKRLEQLTKAAGLLREQSGVRHRETLAATMHSIGVVQTVLKQFDEADASLKEALKIREQLQEAKGDDPHARLDGLSTRVALGQLRWAEGRFPEAHRHWQECLSDMDRLTGGHKDDTVLQEQVHYLERTINRNFAAIGLWAIAVEHGRRNAELGRIFDQASDSQFAFLLAHQGEVEAWQNYSRQFAAQWRDKNPSRVVWLSCILPTPALETDVVLELAKSGVEQNPGRWWKFALALAQLRAGRHQDALNALADVGSHDSWLLAQRLLALAHHGAGQSLEAREWFDKAEATYQETMLRALQGTDVLLELGPEVHDKWWELVYDQALRREAWRAILAQDPPDDPWQHLIQARGYRLIGEVEKAEAELAAAAAAAPDDVEVWIARARLLGEWDEQVRADNAWRGAIEQAAEDPLALLRRGQWYYESEEFAKAEADFREATARIPGFARAPFTADIATAHQQECATLFGLPVEWTNAIGMTFRLIPPGEFLMGTPQAEVDQLLASDEVTVNEKKALAGEAVPHRVFLTQPFYLAQFEVTYSQFRQFVEATGYQTVGERNGKGGWGAFKGHWVQRPEHVWSTPGGWQPDEDEAVCHIISEDAEAFCNWLSKMDGRRYTLPSEAQWEFACRAGTTGLTYAADSQDLASIAWFRGSNPKRPRVVGGLQANAFGLYDMLGNVWEITSDWFVNKVHAPLPQIDPHGPTTGSDRIARGGTWYRQAELTRSGARSVQWNGITDAGTGFRVMISLGEQPPNTLEEAWQKAVGRSGTDPLPWIYRSRWYAERGEKGKAATDLAQALSLASSVAKAPFPAELARIYQQTWSERLDAPVEYTNSIGMKLQLIPPGEFLMGTPAKVTERILKDDHKAVSDRELALLANEGLPHPVRLTQPFYLGQYEVTRDQFRRFVEATGYKTELERDGLGGFSNFEGKWVRRPEHVWSTPGEWDLFDDEPVCLVTYSDAEAFCTWLSKVEGRHYVLPTEAQWEFACRAGTTGSSYAAPGRPLSDLAWTEGITRRPQPVGRKQPNAFGLYDMLGNVWEPCSDYYSPGPKESELQVDPTGPREGNEKVLRGGAWYRSGAVFARTETQQRLTSGFADAGCGFRVAIIGDLAPGEKTQKNK